MKKNELKDALELLQAIQTRGFIWFSNYDTEQRVVAMKPMTIIKNSTLVKLLGLRVCAVIGDGVVVADDYFYSLSEATQQFVLSHEVGHLHCQHVTPKGYARKRLFTILKGEILQMEKEADDFACQLCGGPQVAYKALMELANIVKGLSRKELIHRANRYKVWL